MDAEATVRAYYDALRDGEPLYPFFAREESTVKFGIGERLTGYEEVEAGLRAQTETTEGWAVDSDRLVVAERDDHAYFSDDVFMAWNSLERGIRYEFDTRWSGTLERREDDRLGTDWRFVGMHVSCEALRASGGASSAERRSADRSSGQSPREDGDASEPRATEGATR
ncbi:nuclear transport factor 2 family protein [Natronomonas amylolytica]|uniref:nuclear transport factor 2 family protein n=1 Tax=Natronomonas amylolytica TaxID=3108498 RepID=UPI00300BA606